MTRMLASVANAAEAGVVLQLGADVIDLKDARRGALGAVPLDVARQAIAVVARRSETSAALGDPPYDEEALLWRRWASITSSSPLTLLRSIVSAIV
jgi:(5-formylfuran-3-yl)methyl phosphate synthase